MPGKYEAEVAALEERGIDIWLPFFHRQYEGAMEGRIRRQYMDLAKPPFYPRVLEVSDIKPDETVLDLGCGDGSDIINLRNSGHRGKIVGMETPVSENSEATNNKIHLITQNVRLEGFDNFEIRTGYAEEMDFPDETFDTVWAANVLQECYDIDRALDKIFRVLKPEGKLIAVTNHIDNKPLHHAILKKMAENIGGSAPLPLSSRFNSVTGPKIMARHRHQFSLEHTVIQRGRKNLRLTEENIPYLIASLSSYWYDIKPAKVADGSEINKDELTDFMYLLHSRHEEVLDGVRQEVLSSINATPDKAVYETIKRVAYLYRKRPKAAHFIMKNLRK